MRFLLVKDGEKTKLSLGQMYELADLWGSTIASCWVARGSVE